MIICKPSKSYTEPIPTIDERVLPEFIVPVKALLTMGYTVMLADSEDEIPPVNRVFSDSCHIANVVYEIHSRDHILDMWHEAGHAITSEPEYARGINWEPLGVPKHERSCEFRETYASYAAIYLAVLAGDHDIAEGLSDYQDMEEFHDSIKAGIGLDHPLPCWVREVWEAMQKQDFFKFPFPLDWEDPSDLLLSSP